MSEVLARRLATGLDWEVKRHFSRAYEAMWRDVDYVYGKRDPKLLRLVDRGWSVSRIRVIAVLNAFSRVVLGPLACVARRPFGHPLGRAVTVRYGALISINHRSTVPMRQAIESFETIARRGGIPEKCLLAAHASDLIYALATEEGLEDDS